MQSRGQRFAAGFLGVGFGIRRAYMLVMQRKLDLMMVLTGLATLACMVLR